MNSKTIFGLIFIFVLYCFSNKKSVEEIYKGAFRAQARRIAIHERTQINILCTEFRP
jgi:hypothetical protein